MQSLGHHSASFFSRRNFSSPERRTASTSSETLTGKGDGPAGSTAVDGPETTGNNEGTAGLCWKSFGIPSLRSAAGQFLTRSSATVTFLKGKRCISEDLSITNASILIQSDGECNKNNLQLSPFHVVVVVVVCVVDIIGKYGGNNPEIKCSSIVKENVTK